MRILCRCWIENVLEKGSMSFMPEKNYCSVLHKFLKLFCPKSTMITWGSAKNCIDHINKFFSSGTLQTCRKIQREHGEQGVQFRNTRQKCEETEHVTTIWRAESLFKGSIADFDDLLKIEDRRYTIYRPKLVKNRKNDRNRTDHTNGPWEVNHEHGCHL